MVQALHFAQYNLSDAASEEWFGLGGKGDRIVRELEETFGHSRDVFVDSGGFQLLHADKVDLSRWGLEVTPDEIYRLQLRFDPDRIASLDSPIPPSADWLQTRRLMRISTRNARALLNLIGGSIDGPIPFLVVHGRNPREIRRFTTLLEVELGRETLTGSNLGIALGSQVPIAGNPDMILANASAVLAWMSERTSEHTPLHVFGIGDGVAGEISQLTASARPVSYDNSTYVQNAFRLKVFDPRRREYREYHPYVDLHCGCAGCTALTKLGRPFIADLMSRPAYHPAIVGGMSVNRSDILAHLALHNLSWWHERLAIPARRRTGPQVAPATQQRSSAREGYMFPLSEFQARARNLLLLPCSKGRPYSASKTHRRVVAGLAASQLAEGVDFDRITLSGLFGPVHWEHETRPEVLSYDYTLGPSTSPRHVMFLQLRTASFLSIVRRRYGTVVAYLRGGAYRNAFGPTIERYSAEVSDDPARVANLLRRDKSVRTAG